MAVIGDYLSMKINMGGSTGEALSKARDYRKEKFGKLQAHTERQTNQLAKTNIKSKCRLSVFARSLSKAERILKSRKRQFSGNYI